MAFQVKEVRTHTAEMTLNAIFHAQRRASREHPLFSGSPTLSATFHAQRGHAQPQFWRSAPGSQTATLFLLLRRSASEMTLNISFCDTNPETCVFLLLFLLFIHLPTS